MNSSVRLPGAVIDTTRLGFGCSHLVGGWDRKSSLRLVGAALDAGYRHFDVAPAYGMGTAEAILGEALNGARDTVTIASKIGISRPRHGGWLLAARSAARPIRKLIPSLSRSVGASAYAAAVGRGLFDIPGATRSLAESRRALRTKYLDLLLLHEVTWEDITDELLRFLERQKESGLVGAIGTATSRASTREILERHPGFFDVHQYEWDPLDLLEGRGFPILHGVAKSSVGGIENSLKWASWLSTQVGSELSPSELLGATFAYALASGAGIVLVSSRSIRRIVENAKVLDDPKLVEMGRLLYAAYQGASL